MINRLVAIYTGDWYSGEQAQMPLDWLSMMRWVCGTDALLLFWVASAKTPSGLWFSISKDFRVELPMSRGQNRSLTVANQFRKVVLFLP